jgi:hypothetical protein
VSNILKNHVFLPIRMCQHVRNESIHWISHDCNVTKAWIWHAVLKGNFNRHYIGSC